ncbi:hypothetical protein [Methanoplanus limicola]|uniref:hypothetical protein n=1 Tax=Methanoplanus limicola TaxID=2315 RepID=UPI0012F6B404|nr:hypothetical protein [Methanoplanus limicola]
MTYNIMKKGAKKMVYAIPEEAVVLIYCMDIHGKNRQNSGEELNQNFANKKFFLA